MPKSKKNYSEKGDQDDAVFKALAGKERRQILDLLSNGPKTTGELCKNLSHIDRTTVMLHLKVLENAQLVVSKKKGRSRWNYLDIAPIQTIYERWIADYAQPSAKLLHTLKQHLESQDK